MRLVWALTDKSLYAGEKIPKWQGVISYDPTIRQTLVAPIPLNLLIAWGQRLWWWLKGTERLSDMTRTYELGLSDGRKANAGDEVFQMMVEFLREQRKG